MLVENGPRKRKGSGCGEVKGDDVFAFLKRNHVFVLVVTKLVFVSIVDAIERLLFHHIVSSPVCGFVYCSRSIRSGILL